MVWASVRLALLGSNSPMGVLSTYLYVFLYSLLNKELSLSPPDRKEVVVLHMGQEKNEWVAPIDQEKILLEQQKGEEVSLLEQEHLVPQRISEGKLQIHSSCSPEEWWMKQQTGKPGEQLLLIKIVLKRTGALHSWRGAS